MKTVAEVRKYIQLHKHELTNDQLEALQVEMNRLEDIECGVIQELPQLHTKKDIALAIQELVKVNKIQNSYYVRYFGVDKTVNQMTSGISKDQLFSLYNDLKQ